MIDESSKLDDPMEDPIDEFEHVLRKFDGGIGTLKGSVKETDQRLGIHNQFDYLLAGVYLLIG